MTLKTPHWPYSMLETIYTHSKANVRRTWNRPQINFERAFVNIPCEENYWVATRGGSELSILKLFHFLDLIYIGMDLLFAKELIVPYPLNKNFIAYALPTQNFQTKWFSEIKRFQSEFFTKPISNKLLLHWMVRFKWVNKLGNGNLSNRLLFKNVSSSGFRDKTYLE